MIRLIGKASLYELTVDVNHFPSGISDDALSQTTKVRSQPHFPE